MILSVQLLCHFRGLLYRQFGHKSAPVVAARAMKRLVKTFLRFAKSTDNPEALFPIFIPMFRTIIPYALIP